MLKEKKRKFCPYCGGAQVNHHIVYLSTLLGSFIEPWTNWLSRIIPESSFDWLGLFLLKILTFFKLSKITYELKEDDSGRTQVLWEEAIKRGIKMYEFRLFGIGHDLFISEYNGDKRFFETLPRPKKFNPQGIEWMDNKNKMKQHFKKAGIKVADGDVTGSLHKALKIFNSLKKPVIVKPNTGSRSRHTTIHITNEKDFVSAFKIAKQLSPWIMIEEELSGFVFRGTLIGKKLVATLRREPAYIIGDGIHNIKELIEIENKNPLRNGPIFHQLLYNEETIKELNFWGKTEKTIPEKDEVVTLGQKTSRAVGGGITDVTDIVHPDNKEMLEKAVKVLDDPLVGIDFIMEDVSISWKNQPRCGIIECNSAPFIDLHHFPLVGQPRNVAGKLWDIIYPESKK
jgi:D-alanine-D-alanine ligase-like ATP-grasp enzyme